MPQFDAVRFRRPCVGDHWPTSSSALSRYWVMSNALVFSQVAHPRSKGDVGARHGKSLLAPFTIKFKVVVQQREGSSVDWRSDEYVARCLGLEALSHLTACTLQGWCECRAYLPSSSAVPGRAVVEPSRRSTIMNPSSWHGRELHRGRGYRRENIDENSPSGWPHWSGSI